jgi:hypothetical protein
MIDYLVIIVIMTLAIWLTHRFKTFYHCKLTMQLTKHANGLLFNEDLSDLEKEHQLRQVAKNIIIQFSWIVFTGGGALLLACFPLFVLATIDLVNLDQILNITVSFESLILLVVLGSLFLTYEYHD